MSDYNPTYTCQWRDYEEAKRLREKWWRKVEQRRQRGESLLEAVRPQKVGHMPTAPVITEERPNPLSMELRIVFHYLWEMYDDCLKAARLAQEDVTGQFGGSTAASYERDAKEAVSYAYLLCRDLFDVTSPHAPFHIHSEYGCNDDNCPAWKRGYEAAQENVLDWYEPNS